MRKEDYDLSTYPPDLQPFIDSLWDYEERLSDGFVYYCESRYRETMIAVAQAMCAAARQLPEVQALVHGLRRAEQAIRNLGNGFLTGDAQTIALNEAANIRRDLAPFEAVNE
jgi:hypothetical protein